jgi:hypothetical protein
MKLKQYKYVQEEINSKEFDIPQKPVYFFQTGIRRAIRIVPISTTWNKQRYKKDEEVYDLEFTCIYTSYECKLEKFKIPISQLESIYYHEKEKYHSIVRNWIDGDLDERTQEQFEGELNSIIDSFKK